MILAFLYTYINLLQCMISVEEDRTPIFTSANPSQHAHEADNVASMRKYLHQRFLERKEKIDNAKDEMTPISAMKEIGEKKRIIGISLFWYRDANGIDQYYCGVELLADAVRVDLCVSFKDKSKNERFCSREFLDQGLLPYRYKKNDHNNRRDFAISIPIEWYNNPNPNISTELKFKFFFNKDGEKEDSTSSGWLAIQDLEEFVRRKHNEPGYKLDDC